MPRRNNRRRHKYREPSEHHESTRSLNYVQMAESLVERGLATPAALEYSIPTHRPTFAERNTR